MDPALEEIEFLALSSNRVATLEALRDGPATRRELAAETGASQPTLGRVLRDFQERNWVRHAGGEYEATATGRLVAAGMTDLRDIVELELKLRDLVEWLPTAELDVDLLAFRDATITTPSRTRPSAPVDRVTGFLREAERVRVVSHAFNERSLEAVRQRVLAGEQRFEGVFSATAIDALAADPTLRDRLGDLLASGDAEIYVRDEEIPLAVTVTDETVSLLLRDDDGVLQAAIDADDERVRTWAGDVHERYRTEARPLDPDRFEG